MALLEFSNPQIPTDFWGADQVCMNHEIHGIHEKAWLGFFTLEGVAALCAEFAVRIVDSGVLLLRWAFDVLRSAFSVQAWHGHLAHVSWAGPCHEGARVSHLKHHLNVNGAREKHAFLFHTFQSVETRPLSKNNYTITVTRQTGF